MMPEMILADVHGPQWTGAPYRGCHQYGGEPRHVANPAWVTLLSGQLSLSHMTVLALINIMDNM